MDIGKSKLDALMEMEERPLSFDLMDKSTAEPFKAADGSAVTLTVVGQDSRRVRAALDAGTRKLLASRKAKATPQDLHENRINVAASAVIAWYGLESDGSELPCTSENVRGLLSVPDFLRQVEEKVNEHSDFFVTRSGN